ncbi:MAG: hypothetical protein BMS9Abin13_318 [Patescibacteria group bacterium]|nr:MAG: hypothetical protein BMS9Abin13_318 [Patescibacteria group bacterium]
MCIRKLFAKLKNALERLRTRSVAPLGGGVEIVVLGWKPRVVLKKGRTVVLDLLTLAPEKTALVFSQDGRWHAGTVPLEYRVFFDFPHFPKMLIFVSKLCRGTGDLLSFLHEAGHLHGMVQGELVIAAKERVLLEELKDPNNTYPEKRLRALKEERETTMLSERNAWAFALRAARKLERKFGITLNAHVAKMFVKQCLDSYENYFNCKLLLVLKGKGMIFKDR